VAFLKKPLHGADLVLALPDLDYHNLFSDSHLREYAYGKKRAKPSTDERNRTFPPLLLAPGAQTP
jgi:hypothetical protein